MRLFVFNLVAVGLALPLLVFAAIDINTAGVGTLETLTGIGAVKAQAIVDYREQNGPFSTKSEIMNVSGIGQATYDSIKNDIMVGADNGSPTEEKEDEVTEDDSSSSVVADSSKSTGSSGKPKPLVQALDMTLPEYGFVGQPVGFDVDPSEGTSGRLVRYTWNFGDGTVIEDKNPTHIYQFPGTYVVTVMSYYQNKEVADKRQIKIVPVEVSLSRTYGGDIRIHNQSEYEMDVSGLKLVGRKTFTFPKHSHILPDSIVTISKEKIDAHSGDAVVLLNTFETIMASIESIKLTSAAITMKSEPVKVITYRAGIENFQTPEAVAQVIESATELSEEKEIKNSQVSKPEATMSNGQNGDTNPRWPYLGLAGVLFVGFLSLYGVKK